MARSFAAATLAFVACMLMALVGEVSSGDLVQIYLLILCYEKLTQIAGKLDG